MTDARFLARWEVADVAGAVVAVDVIRAFTTAAYAFAAGARHIFLVDTVAETMGDGDVHPRDITYATRVDGFDFAMEVQRIGDRLRLDKTYP